MTFQILCSRNLLSMSLNKFLVYLNELLKVPNISLTYGDRILPYKCLMPFSYNTSSDVLVKVGFCLSLLRI